MSLLVTGSIGIDTVEAPWGKVVDALGGSSVYFSCAAGFFAPVRFVGVVGEDCPPDFLKPLADNPRIDLGGLEVRPGARTFRWHGRYHEDVNLRDTVAVELNVVGEKGPTIPQAFRDSRYVFLANTHPALQAELLAELAGPELVVADTMDLWIHGERAALDALIARIDAIVLNDSEARLLTGHANVVTAGLAIAERVGADRPAGRAEPFVVVKKGEHGSMLFAGGHVCAMPAWPARKVVDPTGAGDSFAGAMMGHIAATGRADHPTLRRAMAYGSVVASFTLEEFSLAGLLHADRGRIEERMKAFEEMLRF
ncbi:MAG TPA: PfkB family carbohydrate kinase [Phycisphaerae bacterium]|nr:PfkB family carbohydrate kinase [Phycisphaerae bacterium]